MIDFINTSGTKNQNKAKKKINPANNEIHFMPISHFLIKWL